LTQVFQNLIDNAIKYGNAGSEIRISARQADSGSTLARRLGRPGVAVAVADKGAGIAREHLPRLTERFYRVDPARSHKLGGTGLGLAIVKHILNRHRGLLDIDSTVGEGSVFTVSLPLAGEDPADSA
jgi:two-component system, OmpR family, phosphate regulon sensor histidine kinase PhoR